ncbi:unnamed protein product, partial [Mesorhabditis spiculigera]
MGYAYALAPSSSGYAAAPSSGYAGPRPQPPLPDTLEPEALEVASEEDMPELEPEDLEEDMPELEPEDWEEDMEPPPLSRLLDLSEPEEDTLTRLPLEAEPLKEDTKEFSKCSKSSREEPSKEPQPSVAVPQAPQVEQPAPQVEQPAPIAPVAPQPQPETSAPQEQTEEGYGDTEASIGTASEEKVIGEKVGYSEDKGAAEQQGQEQEQGYEEEEEQGTEQKNDQDYQEETNQTAYPAPAPAPETTTAAAYEPQTEPAAPSGGYPAENTAPQAETNYDDEINEPAPQPAPAATYQAEETSSTSSDQQYKRDAAQRLGRNPHRRYLAARV